MDPRHGRRGRLPDLRARRCSTACAPCCRSAAPGSCATCTGAPLSRWRPLLRVVASGVPVAALAGAVLADHRRRRASAQILGTVCLIRAFDARDFAVGTVFAKTEVVQVAVFSSVLLGEPLRWGGWLGAGGVHGRCGAAGHEGRASHVGRDAAAGRAVRPGRRCGCSGLAAIGIRGATKALADGPARDARARRRWR